MVLFFCLTILPQPVTLMLLQRQSYRRGLPLLRVLTREGSAIKLRFCDQVVGRFFPHLAQTIKRVNVNSG